MRLRWSAEAFDDFERIIAYIRERSASGAYAMVRRIYAEIEMLESFPVLARPGRVEGTRELVVAPYVVIYEVGHDMVNVLRIYHGAQSRK